MRTFAKLVAALAGLFYLVFGIWAFAGPRSFASNIANYGTYNEHLTHDLGAFQIGLGVAALAGLLLSDALAAVLAGVAAGSIMHGLSHIMDSGTGGRASDPWTVSLIGLLVLLAFLVAARRRADRSARAARQSPDRVPAGPRR
jgi:hypothetical protein